MPTNTYVALDKITVGTATSTITFTSIPSGYTDLVAVLAYRTTNNDYISMRVNNLSSSVYSFTQLYGTGSTAGSARVSSQTEATFEATPTAPGINNAIIHFQNYSNTTTNKSYLLRSNDSAATVRAIVGLVQTTNAINRLDFYVAGTFASGTTVSLYGIAADTNAYTPKATGGTITADVGYIYHTFTSTGTFTPNQTLTCDVLVVGGGGGGSAGASGVYPSGAAASVVSEQFNQTATVGAKTVTVGGGGAGSTTSGVNGSAGGNSSITLSSTISATGGGGGLANGTGGSNASYSGGTGSNLTGGGAGAGANGGNGSSSVAGQGGAGVLSTILGYRIAGGGNGSGFSNPSTQPASVDGGGRGGNDGTGFSGAAPTTYGSGAGGAFNTAFRNGFDGVVVIRYAK